MGFSVGMVGRDVIDAIEDKTRLNASHVQRQHSGRQQAVALPGRHERLPDNACILRPQPEFIAQIARIAGAG